MGTPGDLLFYDGTCGLCHGAVRFLLSRDPARRDGEPVFRFAPLQGETFQRLIPPEQRRQLPDSLVIATRCGELLVRSRAVLYALSHLSRPWRFLATLGRLLPAWLLDAGYRLVAGLRARLWRRPDTLCPLLPPHLASRFLP